MITLSSNIFTFGSHTSENTPSSFNPDRPTEKKEDGYISDDGTHVTGFDIKNFSKLFELQQQTRKRILQDQKRIRKDLEDTFEKS